MRRKSTAGISIGFESADSADVKISYDGMAFYISSGLELGEMSMMSQEVTPAEKGKPLKLKEMQIISVNGIRIVPQQMLANGVQIYSRLILQNRIPGRMLLYSGFQG